MVTTEKPKINKSAFVRNILKEIGAVTANPPDGWREQVREALEKQNLDMHNVTIYQIRRQLINGEAPIKKTRKTKDKTTKVKAAKAIKAKAGDVNVNGNLTVADLHSLVEFSKKFGGLDGLNDAVNAIKSFKG